MGILLSATVSSKLGLASHQNAVPLLRQLTITNDGDESLEALIVEFEPSLPFAEAKSWRIDRLEAHSAIDLPDRDIELKEGLLAELNESVRSSVHFRVRSASAELAEQHLDIELLARSDWGGAGSMPELLPVFCTPNDPAVDRLLKAASDVLRRAGLTVTKRAPGNGHGWAGVCCGSGPPNGGWIEKARWTGWTRRFAPY